MEVEAVAKQKQVRSILWTRATELINNAAEQDEKKNYKESLRLFLEAGSVLIEARKIETDDAKRQLLRAKLEEVLYSAEKLKQVVDQEEQKIQMQQQSVTSPISWPAVPQTIPVSVAPVQEMVAPVRVPVQEQPMSVPQVPTRVAPVVPQPAEQTQILANIEGVQCYAILGTGKQLMAEGCLKVLKSSNGIKSLQLESIQFPLSASLPVLKTTIGHYIIPMNENIYYGFVFPNQIPEIYLRIFESLLADTCAFRVQTPPKPQAQAQAQQAEAPTTLTPTPQPQATATSPSTAQKTIPEKISSGLQTGTGYVVVGIEKTASALTSGLSKGGEFVISKTEASEKPAEVPPMISNTLQVASAVSPYFVKASNIIANGISTAVGAVGSALAEKVYQSFPASNGPKSEAFEAVKTVGSAAVVSVVQVWDALESAGKVLLVQTKETTVGIVDHKYGKMAADTAKDGFTVVMDTAQTVYNVKQVGAKKILKNTVKETGLQTAKKVIGSSEATAKQ